MSEHRFNFKGGEILSKIGATFFVSHLYFKVVDNTHLNWNDILTKRSRIANINKAEEYHMYWLELILEMKNENLEKNTLGLKGNEVKMMAQQILDKYKIVK
jgi:hypothetical protein